MHACAKLSGYSNIALILVAAFAFPFPAPFFLALDGAVSANPLFPSFNWLLYTTFQVVTTGL